MCIRDRGYVDGPAAPLYSFGYGLSYTTFEKSGLKLSARAIPTDGELLVTVADKNTGREQEMILSSSIRRFTVLT